VWLIHPSAWKGSSANFGCSGSREFTEEYPPGIQTCWFPASFLVIPTGSCAPLWRPWSIGTEPSTLEGRREAAVHEYPYGMDRRPRKHEAAYVPRLAYIAQHLRDLEQLRRVRDRFDREYAQPLDVEALARGAHMSAGHLSRPYGAAHRARDGAAASWRSQRHRGLFCGRLLVAGHLQHPLRRAGRCAAQRLLAPAARATAGMPSCVAK
jgi:hypothetical protein